MVKGEVEITCWSKKTWKNCKQITSLKLELILRLKKEHLVLVKKDVPTSHDKCINADSATNIQD